jgi:hypothetical protein
VPSGAASEEYESTLRLLGVEEPHTGIIAFWERAVRPLLDAASPRVVVEIGTLNGQTTERLCELAAQTDGVAHSIDPSPGPDFDPDALAARFGDRFVFHRRLSLEALGGIGAIDAVLIDGDHNWYTVYNELKILEQRAAQDSHPFALTILHDVGWPYGRRDLYYDPDVIPEDARHPFRQAGIVPGRKRLSDNLGFRTKAPTAVEENTPRNGVRTAVEDFLAETSLELTVRDLPGFSGLSILVPPERLDGNEALRHTLEGLYTPDWLLEHCRRLEAARIYFMAQLSRIRWELREGRASAQS